MMYVLAWSGFRFTASIEMVALEVVRQFFPSDVRAFHSSCKPTTFIFDSKVRGFYQSRSRTNPYNETIFPVVNPLGHSNHEADLDNPLSRHNNTERDKTTKPC
jgi:hypothetical protein